jgi:glycosyltransferase involved in cell wall biosynthesis
LSSKRIAIVLQTPRDQHSAVLITYQSLAAELVRLGHAVSIVTPQDFALARRWGGRWTPLVYPLVVGAWMRRHASECDLVVFHSYAGWRAAAVAASRGVAAAVAFHGLEPMYYRELVEEMRPAGGLSFRYRVLQEQLMPFFLRRACRSAALVTCLNSAERQVLVDDGWAPADRVVTVSHGVRDDFFVTERPTRPVKKLLFVGQWLQMKGAGYVRGAFTWLARRHADLQLVCAGTLAGASEVLEGFPAEIRDRVTVLPRVDQPALPAIYRDADVFIFPSSYEGFGLALVEAMAARLPIVTTAVGVAAEALRDGGSALVVPKRDSPALADAVERLIADQDLRQLLGARAQEAARNYRERDCVRAWAHALTSIDRVS